MDVVVAGGVAERQLRVHTEIWDRLLQEFLLFLRNFAAQSVQQPEGANAGATEAVAEAAAAE